MTIREIEERLAHQQPHGERYAVLVPLVEWAGDLYLLFEVRARTMHRQPGETCFPGGRMESGETPEDCALRETWEELGVPADQLRPLGRLEPLRHQAGFVTYPVVAQMDAGAVLNMSANPEEVAETFLVPMDFFRQTPPEVHTFPLRPEVGEDFPYDRIGFPQGYPWKGGRAEIPIWNFKAHPIWGLTARVVRELLSILEEDPLPEAGR